MQSLIILLSWILLFNSGIIGHDINFPAEDCAGILSGDYAPCARALTDIILRWHKWSENKPDGRCGFSCKSNLKGRFTKFTWKWDGRFQCDSKAPGIVGEATKFSRAGAIEWAVTDFSPQSRCSWSH